MRPTGIILIVFYNFLVALFFVYSAITLVTTGVTGTMPSLDHSIPSGTDGEVVRAVGAGFFLVFALIAALVSYGMWSFREWARMLRIVLSGIPILLALPGLFFDFSFYQGGYLKVSYRLVRLAIDILIIWYLGQPYIKALFHKTLKAPQV